MNRSRVIIASVIVLLLVGAYLYVSTSSTRHIYTSLTDRAKEYLKQKSENGGADYNSILGNSVNKVDVNFRKQSSINDCFNFTVPYEINNTYSQGKCSNYFSFAEPYGTLVAYLEQSSLSSLADYTGVTFRRQNSDKYRESNETIKGRDFIIFTKIDQSQGVEESAFTLGEGKLFVLTLTLNLSEKETTRVLEGMLSSLVVY